MKTSYLVIATLLFSVIQVNAQVWDWTHPEPNAVAVDNSNSNADATHDIEMDSSGNIYVLGNFYDSLYLNNNLVSSGKGGSYLAKYDSSGKLIWKRLIVQTSPNDEIAFSSNIRATDLTVNPTGVYITGKYLPTQYYYDCNTHDITVGVVRSYNIGNSNFNSQTGEIGVFITKFNNNGSVVSNKIASHPDSCYTDLGYADNTIGLLSYPLITSDKKNNIISAFVLNADHHSFSMGSDVIPLRASDAINPAYLIVLKYNSTGTLQWSTYAGGGFNAGLYDGNGYIRDCNSIITDKNNNIFFLGMAHDSAYFGTQLFRTSAGEVNGVYAFSTFISKISSSGVWQFAKELSNTYDAYMKDGTMGLSNPEKLAVDNTNNLYALVDAQPQIILGDTVSFSANNIKATCYLVKMNNSGNLTWVKSFGNTAATTFANSIQFNNGGLYICGSNPSYDVTSNQKLVFSDLYVPYITGFNTNEYYVAKTDLSGNFIWITTMQGELGSSSYGAAIKAFNGNIYTAGNYQHKITSLGNLNGNFTNPNFYTPNIFFGKLKDQYIKIGQVTPTTLCPGSNISIPFTSYGLTFSNKNKFTAELSNSSGDFTSPITIGTIKSTGSGSITGTIPATLAYGSGYVVRIRSSDTLKTGYNYYAYADTPYKIKLLCPAPASGFNVTNITGNSATLNWNVVDCAKGYKVQYRKKATTAWTPVLVNSNTGTININGLTPNTTYQWRVATKCKASTVVYSSYSAIKQFKTATSFAAVTSVTDATVQSTTTLIKVYPNPTNNTAIVQVNSIKINNYTIELADISGKILQTKTVMLSPGENKIAIDVSKYVPGVYMINVINNEGKTALKLNKE